MIPKFSERCMAFLPPQWWHTVDMPGRDLPLLWLRRRMKLIDMLHSGQILAKCDSFLRNSTWLASPYVSKKEQASWPCDTYKYSQFG